MCALSVENCVCAKTQNRGTILHGLVDIYTYYTLTVYLLEIFQKGDSHVTNFKVHLSHGCDDRAIILQHKICLQD